MSNATAAAMPAADVPLPERAAPATTSTVGSTPTPTPGWRLRPDKASVDDPLLGCLVAEQEIGRAHV